MTMTTAFNGLESIILGGGCALLHRGWAINAWISGGHSTALMDGDISFLVGLLCGAWWWIGKTKISQRG